MDFSKLGSTKKNSAPIDPLKVFETLPSLGNTPNDLWRGQAEALSAWNNVRSHRDVLVSLNTGAGKTIVGLLIAQSLVNESVENVVYVCSTIDLVKQTAAEADRIGLAYTTRLKGDFSNDLFESGRAFCITTYAALFNGRSTLRKKYFPGAIIFDDAHVAESILRDAFTLRIDSADFPSLFQEIADLFKAHFKELGASRRFKESLSKGENSTAFVAPRGLQERSSQLEELFERYEIKDHKSLGFSYAHLQDHFDGCAAIFTKGVFELSPPFLPSLALDIFERPLRRVYLSATLQSQTDFVRAFGRTPSKTITPSNDAGNGERLIILGKDMQEGFSADFAKAISKKDKIVIAVPSYPQAKNWESVATPPDVDKFSDALNNFRKAETGAFTLVSRVDGIDLPHDTCRMMLTPTPSLQYHRRAGSDLTLDTMLQV